MKFAQFKAKHGYQEVNLCLCSLYNESYISHPKKHQEQLNTRLFLLFQYNMIGTYTNTRLNGNSIQDSVLRGNWNVTRLYILSLLKCLQRKYCSLPFFFLTLSHPPDFIFLCSSLPSAENVCLHFSLYFSNGKPPSWKKPCKRRSCCRASSDSPSHYGCPS